MTEAVVSPCYFSHFSSLEKHCRLSAALVFPAGSHLLQQSMWKVVIWFEIEATIMTLVVFQ